MLVILAESRGSELVREGCISDDAFSETVPALSRTSSLPRLRAEAFPGSPGLMYNAERPVSGHAAL
ncbi:hypothetical protein CVE28_13060 [Pseudomonas syringae pv. actinidiae]|nr:hypothetical protein [Pseudomonas syringae pv. actinidiae]